MKRRMLAVLLTLIMVIGMMPATAFAAPAFADIDGLGRRSDRPLG